MNGAGFDPAKLVGITAAAINRQSPGARAELLAAVRRSEVEVRPDRAGYVTLSIEGAVVARVHESRLVRAPADPGSN